jgi:c-di-GMP-binding flagellar brake protein YcgR
MEADFTERRRHIRIFFDSLEEASCLFIADEKAVTLWSASVLDLSLGGLHLTLIGDADLSVGDRLILCNLTHRTGQVCDEQISMEVRWLFTRPEFRRLYVGCRFLHLPEKSRGHIANLISVKLLEASTVRSGTLNN